MISLVVAFSIFIQAFTSVPHAWIATCEGRQFSIPAISHEHGIAEFRVTLPGQTLKAWGVYRPDLHWKSTGACGEVENTTGELTNHAPWTPKPQPELTHVVWMPIISR